MSDDEGDDLPPPTFRPFTRDEFDIIESRIFEKKMADKKKEEKEKKFIEEFGSSVRARKQFAQDDDEDEDEDDAESGPNPRLSAGSDLPRRYGQFPLELANAPLVDIDPFYADKRTFIVITKSGTIFRFSSTNAMFLLSPFNPIRRIALVVLTHPLFSFAIISTILVNCQVMIKPESEYTASTEVVFTAIYTFESAIKLLSRGFALEDFTYLRDPWNWLDFSVIGMSYVTIAIDLGAFSALRTFRVFRALKSVAVIPGLKTIVSAIVYSVKNLRDVIILTCFVLAVFALLGLQVYMGGLSQKCVRNYPTDPEELQIWGNLTHETWDYFMHNDSNWWVDGDGNYAMCGNSSGAGKCESGFTCMQGFGPNPNYGYTSFDNFFEAYLCAFRLMTQDFWENLYMISLATAGPGHIGFFIVNIFLGSFYLVNLILAIVALSYEELKNLADTEAQRELEELEAIREAEEAAIAEAEAAAMEAMGGATDGLFDFGSDDEDRNVENIESAPRPESAKSLIRKPLHEKDPTDSRQTSCPEKLMVPSEDADHKQNKMSDLSGAPSFEESDQSLHESQNGFIKYHDADKQIPYADDSAEVTPNHYNGGLIRDTHSSSLDKSDQSLPGQRNGFGLIKFVRRPSMDNSYSNLSEKYNSSTIRKPLVHFTYQDAENHFPYADASIASTPVTPKHHNGGVIIDAPLKLSRKCSYTNFTMDTMNNQFDGYRNPHQFASNGGRESLGINDVMILNEIIDRISERPSSSLAGDSNYLVDDDDEGPKMKDIIMECLKKCCGNVCVLDCCWLWIRISEVFSIFVFDPFTELFITLCIVVNVVFMSLDHYNVDYDGMSPFMTSLLINGNYFFTVVFIIESSVKLFAMSPRYFFGDAWNCFDFVIVAFSLVELLAEGVSGLSMLRSFRLLRVFKLAKSWKSLNDILIIMAKTLPSLSNLTFVLCIIIFIFAVMGMQLFGKDYSANACLWEGCVIPRWHYMDFFHSFMIVFRVLCGEWIESMWDCIFVSGPACIPYFMATVLIGNLVILNLFLALLLSSFSGMGEGAEDDDEPDKMQIAFGRFGTFKRFIIRKIKEFFSFLKRKIVQCFTGHRPNYNEEMIEQGKENLAMDVNHPDMPKSDLNSATSNITNPMSNESLENGRKEKDKLLISYMDKNMLLDDTHSIGKGMDISINNGKYENEENCSESVCSGGSGWRRSKKVKDSDPNTLEEAGFSECGSDKLIKEVEEVSHDPVDEIVVEDCCPPGCYQTCPCCVGDPDSPMWQVWYKHRLQISILIENKYFETVVLALILLSSFVMTLEDVWYTTKPLLMDSLFFLDRILTVVFFLETCLKLLAMGVVAYFGNAWCWLDFVIVGVSLLNFGAGLLGAGNIPIFKTMRTLRALRPLRAMAKMEGMKVVVGALVGALPSIFNVLTVCIIFWLIFAIIGVNTFMGRFQECVDEDGNRFNHEIVPNKSVCLNLDGGIWVNPRITFDNVGIAYLSLFQIATFKGWMDIMDDAVDAVELNQQPFEENSLFMYLFFVAFIVFGSFFTLNLLVGVIIDKFNEQKNKGGSSLDAFMTEEQKRYLAAMKKAQGKKPVKALPRPNWAPQAIVFGIIMNKKFDMIIMGFIGLNMVCMMCDHFGQSKEWTFVLDNLNLGFIVIFTAEMILKMFALGKHYYYSPWNLFDFVVVLMSLASLFLSDLIEKYFVSPTLLRVVRVAKVGRVLRLIKGAKGIRTLLFSLIMAMPALLNIALLLGLVMFIFAVFGVSLFKNVKIRGGFNDVHNFKTFFKTFILLFVAATSASWDGTLNAIFDDTDCTVEDPEIGEAGDCGKFAAGVAFLILYLTLSFLIIVNMYIAVILENYSQATEDVAEGITDEDYDLFYEIWTEFDPDGTQYIEFSSLSEFVDILEPPLQLPRPNKFKLVNMNIPIAKWTDPQTGEVRENQVFCSDILDALTREFFAIHEEEAEDSQEQNETQATTFADRPGYERTSSTLWKQREEYCAGLIQQAWREHHKGTVTKGSNARKVVTASKENEKTEDLQTQSSGKHLIEVQSENHSK